MYNAHELTSDQRRLVLWLATTENEREPKVLDALATEIGVRPATIQRWRSRKLDALAAEEARMRLLEHLPEVYETLANKARDGSHEHIALFMRVASGYGLLRTTPTLPGEPRDFICQDVTTQTKGEDNE